MENRIQLAEYFAKQGFNYGAEIGVADGRYSEILLEKNPQLQLVSVDPYAPYDGNWRSQDYQNKAYEQAKERLSKFGSRCNIVRSTGVEASINMKDDYLDFVFIDGDHAFDAVMTDIILWTQKVRKGGIVSGHDYYHHKAGGVVPAVNKYTEIHGFELNIIPRYEGGHADDKAPCWWFVKK